MRSKTQEQTGDDNATPAVDQVVMRDLRPMSEAPRDGTEILACHKEGKNFHPVQWKDRTCFAGEMEHWGMRWREDYRQYDCDYDGWVTYPVSGAQQR